MAKKITNFLLLKKRIYFILFLSIFFFPAVNYASQAQGSVSIIIDDMGYDHYVMQKFYKIDLPIAFSFLPDTPYVSMSKAFYKKGYTVMLHMPSQPLNPKLKGGSLELKVTDSREQISSKLDRAYREIPCASGFNNHMGSKFMQDKQKMEIVINFLKLKHLFFIDSMTTPHSVGYRLACKKDVPFAVNDLFIDNVKSLNSVEKKLLFALKLAHEGYNMVVIGHDNIVDYEAILHLKDKLQPYLKDIRYNLKQCQ